MQNLLKLKPGPKANLFILQVGIITVIVLALTVVKFIGGDIYTDVKNWYIFYFGSETSISEVLVNVKDSSQTESGNELENTTPHTLNTAAENEAPEHRIAAVKTVRAVIETDRSSLVNTGNSFCKPVDNAVISDVFGYRTNPITYSYEMHKGLDLAVPNGTHIRSAASGTVIYSGKSPTYGNYIHIDHGQGLQTLYAHCSRLYKAKGDTVKKGENIATVGSTGQSTGPHLHFEVRINGEFINPQWLIKW